MSDNFKHLQLRTIDSHLAQIEICDTPSQGWIKTIRTTLGMTSQQLAKRMGIRQQSVTKLEQREISGTITLNSLRKAADALNCHVVYALVPHTGSLKNTIQDQALKKATTLVAPVDHTMMLEAQQVGDTTTQVQKVAQELEQSLDSSMWDE